MAQEQGLIGLESGDRPTDASDLRSSRVRDLRGRTFGKLAVLTFAGLNKHKQAVWACKCECGTEKPVSASALVSGGCKSCGCGRSGATIVRCTTHGEADTRLYRIWQGMKYRCLVPSSKGYRYYGGRGILICDSWRTSFLTFREWANANGYAENLTIERRNGDGNYEPDNCEWIPQSDQSMNRSNCVLVTAFGETKPLGAWAKDPRCVVSYWTLRHRIERTKCDPEQAITRPLQAGKKLP
jgi:hypothetical protein